MSKAITTFFKKQKNREALVGFLIIFVFIIASILTNKAIFAAKNSGYGYGYSAGSYGYGYQYSDALPSAPSNFSCNANGSGAITCTWSAVTTTTAGTNLDNFSSYKVYYSTSSPASSSDTLVATVTSQNSGLTATQSGLNASTTYYFAIYTNDDNGNSSSAATASATTAGAGGGGGGASAAATEESAETATAEESKAAGTEEGAEEAAAEVPAEEIPSIPSDPADRDLDAELSGINTFVDTIGNNPSTDAEWKVVHFIAYGTTDESKDMSVRDRQGVMTDYYHTYGIFPANDQDWHDVALILSGHMPVVRSLTAEQYGLPMFISVYKKLPDDSKYSEDQIELNWWAVHYISYKIRPGYRDLDKERFAISVFKSVFGNNPESSLDWAVVRAIAYTGATR